MEALAKRLARGEPAAFAELYDDCADRLYHYLIVRLRSSDAAGDVLQDTFVRLARSRRRFAGVENPVAYAFAVARNEAHRAAGRRVREEGLLTATADELFVAAPDDHAAREAAESVAGAMARLSEELREIIELKHYSELTFREIAEVTGLPQGTAATRYRTAIGRLRGFLAKEWS
ncbi:MAG TPA: RNA polymerase sigma factor [Pirellulales bacterium]|nr:RNA polymerase sigma factor [Pirellulales bacterium]